MITSRLLVKVFLLQFIGLLMKNLHTRLKRIPNSLPDHIEAMQDSIENRIRLGAHIQSFLIRMEKEKYPECIMVLVM